MKSQSQVARQPGALQQHVDPLRLQAPPQFLEPRQVCRVVEPRPGRGRGLAFGSGVEGIDGLVPEAGHAILDEVGAHHAVDESRLPGLVDHVATLTRLEVRRQALQQRGQVHALLLAAAPCFPDAQLRIASGLLDPPHADAAVASVLLEHSRAISQALGQIPRQLFERADAHGIASERKIADVDQDVLRPDPEDRLRMRAHEDALLRDLPQHGIEPAPPPLAHDRVGPDEDAVDAAQLRGHLVGELVVVDGGLGRHARVAQGVEEGREPALPRIRSISRGAIARVEQGELHGPALRYCDTRSAAR